MAIIISDQSFSNRRSMSIHHDDGSSKYVTCEENVYITEEVPIDESQQIGGEQVYIDIGVDITKAKNDEQLVSGWANVSVNADGSIPLDWQDDVIAPETLEKAAIQFMLDYRESGEMHKGDSKGVVVESIVFTKEKQDAIGIPDGTVPQGWFITVKVLDKDVFDKVKDGTYRMFSIQGTCNRVKV